MTCGGIVNKYFTANLLQSLTVNFLKNRLRINKVTAMNLVSPFLGTEHGDISIRRYTNLQFYGKAENRSTGGGVHMEAEYLPNRLSNCTLTDELLVLFSCWFRAVD